MKDKNFKEKLLANYFMTGYNSEEQEGHAPNTIQEENEDENPWRFDLPKSKNPKEKILENVVSIKVPKLFHGHSVIRKSLGGGDNTFLTYSKEGEEEEGYEDNTDRFSTIFNVVQEEPIRAVVQTLPTEQSLPPPPLPNHSSSKSKKLKILENLELEKTSLLSSYFSSFDLKLNQTPIVS